MLAEDERSLDVAKSATIDLMALNNKVVSMRATVKKAKARVIQKLVRQIQVLRKKKGQPEMLEKNKRKAGRFVEEIHVIKNLNADKISKYAMGNTISLAEMCKKGAASSESRALTRLSETPVIKAEVTKFRSCHSDWPSLTAFLLMKQSGRRYKKKKNVQTTDKIEANIKARETMMQTYLGKKLKDSVQAKNDDEEEKDGSRSERISFSNVGPDHLQEPGDLCDNSDVDSSKSPDMADNNDDDDDSDDDGDGDDHDDGDGNDDSECEKSQILQGIGLKRSTAESSTLNVSGTMSGRSPSKEHKLPADVPSSRPTDRPKGRMKLELLQSMFSSRTDDSNRDSDSGCEELNSSAHIRCSESEKQRSKHSKASAKIMKELLPANSSDESFQSESDESEPDMSEASYTTKTRSPVHQSDSGIMVVKKIDLDNLENDEDLKAKPGSEAGLLTSVSTVEVKKSKDSFFLNSDDDSDAEDESASEDSSEEGQEEEGERMTTFDSTFIGTLSHKKRLKWGGGGGRDGDGWSNVRGHRGSWREERGRHRGGGVSERGRGGGGVSERGRGGWRGSERGRGGGFSRGRGGRGFQSESRWSGSSRGTKYGHNMFDRESHRSRDGQASASTDSSRTVNISAKLAAGSASKAETLHPSWEASKRKKEQSGILQFKGKKIKFDD